jgi:hypothetical protein
MTAFGSLGAWIVGGAVGLVVMIRACRSLCQGGLATSDASDDDLRPHPRLRRSTR